MRILRALSGATLLLALNCGVRAQTFTQVQWGLARADTPSELCTMNGAACSAQIGQINSANVWTPTLRSVFGASTRNNNVVCDGATDIATTGQAALNANAGGTVYFPYTGSNCVINTVTLTQPSPPANIVVDSGVNFTGTGNMPQLLTNTFQNITGSFLTKTFTGAAFGQTLAIEGIGTSAYTGNAVALYLGVANATTAGAINGNYVAFNPVAIANPGAGGTGAVVNSEFDCNEFRANNYIGCVHITGVGSFDPQYGILMDYVGTHNWTIGYIGRRFTTGIYLDATLNDPAKPADTGMRIQGVPNKSFDIIGTGADANVGISLTNIKQNHIKIIPSVDAAGVASLYGTNAANSVVNWSIQTDGLGFFTNLRVGALTGYMKANGASNVTAAATVPLSDLAAQATNTIVGNATSGSAAPTALTIGTCSAATSALTWTTNSGFGCNTLVAGVANPTATIGLTAVNGTAASAMRSDAAPPLSQSIVPTWTGIHTFSAAPVFSLGAKYSGSSSGTVTVVASATAGTPTITWGNASGTPAVTASAPLALSTTTGNMTVTGAAGQVLAGSTPAFTATPTLGVAGSAIGTLALAGNTSGTATITPQATAGSPTLTLPNASGTFAVSATSPVAVSATTGNVTCTTCVTSSGGGAITGTAPVAVSAAGAVSVTGAAGQVLAGASPAFTATPTLGVAGSTVGSLAFANATSGSVTLQPVTGALGSAVLSLPAATDTLIGKATTDTLTNKTYDTAGTGNSFSINGVAATANTGTGAVARATSPTFATPTLGAATATSLTAATLIGGTGAASTLTLESTSGVGTTDAIIGLTGSQVERFRVMTDGKFNIGPNVAPDALLTINANTGATVAPDGTNVHIIGADSANMWLEMDVFGGTPVFATRRADGTRASKTAIAIGENMMAFLAKGYDGTSYASGAELDFNAAEAWTTTHHGSYIAFQTVAIGSTAQAAAFYVEPSGSLTIGATHTTVNSPGELAFGKIAASGVAPGAGFLKIAAVAGTNANTCKIIAYAGTSTTPVTVVDNVGTGC